MKKSDTIQATYKSRFLVEQKLSSKGLIWMTICFCLIISLVAVIYRGAAVEWALLILTSMTFVLSYLAPLMVLKGIEVKRTWTTQGIDTTQIALNTTIERKWLIPSVWLATVESVVNESENDAAPIELKQQYEPFFYRKMSQQFTLQHLKRGQYKSESVTVLVGDLFGLTILRKDMIFPLDFCVLPTRLVEQEQTYVNQLTSQKWTDDSRQAVENVFLQGNKLNEKQGEAVFSGIDGIRPYSEGDSIHHIYFHTLSRGMGVHVFENEKQLSMIRQVIFLDQYLPPMSPQLYIQQFNTLIGWIIDRVLKDLEHGPVLIVTDNWCYECYEYFQIEELRRLLATVKADVQYSIIERLLSLAQIIPSQSKLLVYTTDWKNNEGWTELAQLAWHKKTTVSLQLLSENRIMTYSMREQQKEFEQNGLETIWRYSNLQEKAEQIVREGSEAYANT